MNDMNIKLRPITAADIAALGAIEAACFSRPWSAASLGLLLTPAATALVAEAEGTVVGYLGLLRIPPDEWEFTNIGVLPAHRRRGIGRALVTAMQEAAIAEGIGRVTLEVREKNAPALALYQSAGFCPVGTRKNYYKDPPDHAVIMEWKPC